MNTIYTIGYTGLGFEDLKQWLDAQHAVLVDTRLNPYSPQNQWKKFGLTRALGEGYQHVESLGNINYKNGGPITLKDAAAGINTVRALLEASPVVLLCTCANVHTCHRKLAAETIAEATGAEIVHISKSDVKRFILSKLGTGHALTAPADWDTLGAQVNPDDTQPGLPGFGAPDILIPLTQLSLL